MGKPKLPGHIQRRGNAWRVCLRVDGKAFWFGARAEPVLKYGTRNDVIEWAWSRYQDLKKAAKREADGQLGRVRFSALIAQYRNEKLPLRAPGTQRSYNDSLKPIERYFVTERGDPLLDAIRARHIEAFLSWRRVHRPDGTKAEPPVSARSLVKDRAVLHQLFAFADRMEYREGNPVQRVEKPKADERQPIILNTTQYNALLDACEEPTVFLYVLLCGETGARCESEALWVRWEDVDLDDGFVKIVSGRDDHRTKTGKTRHCPLTPRLKAALREHFAVYRFAVYNDTRPEFVFHHTRTRRHYKVGQRVLSFRRAVRGAMQRANVALEREELDPIPTGKRVGWVMHDLRHRRVTTWLADGKSPVLVKEAMGHSALATTMRYTHLVKEHLRALVEEREPGVSTTNEAAL